jgi:hypothetical protein
MTMSGEIFASIESRKTRFDVIRYPLMVMGFFK